MAKVSIAGKKKSLSYCFAVIQTDSKLAALDFPSMSTTYTDFMAVKEASAVKIKQTTLG
ncbi:MAG: hypothetical protein V5804_05650 [Mucilaginibacter sp.]|uniref:hypothetical protein n=1 Tax=Mucilaginibacter sp. TaxID=1882438 RepID=UPI0034E4463C